MVSTNEVFNVRKSGTFQRNTFPLWDTVTFTVLYVYTTTPYREDNPYPPCGDALGNYIASALTTVM
jgi:hypothetical protein